MLAPSYGIVVGVVHIVSPPSTTIVNRCSSPDELQTLTHSTTNIKFIPTLNYTSNQTRNSSLPIPVLYYPHDINRPKSTKA